MKKVVLTVLISFGTTIAFAQPILNKMYDFQIGHTYSYRKTPLNWNIDTAVIPTIGSNLTWNFDTVNLEPTTLTDSILSPIGKPGTNSFNGADFVWKEYSGTYQYYRKTTDTIFYMGNYSSWASTFTPNPMTVIFPSSMSSGYIYSNFQTVVAGNGNWVYDARYNAFGTLKLPGVTHQDVGLYVTVGGKGNLSFADYFWFKENQVDPLMRIQFVWTLSGSAVQYLYMSSAALQPSSIASVRELQCQLFPNPSTSMLFLKANEEMKSVKIFSIYGQVVQQNAINGVATSIDISHLPVGIYTAHIEDANEKFKNLLFTKR